MEPTTFYLVYRLNRIIRKLLKKKEKVRGIPQYIVMIID